MKDLKFKLDEVHGTITELYKGEYVQSFEFLELKDWKRIYDRLNEFVEDYEFSMRTEIAHHRVVENKLEHEIELLASFVNSLGCSDKDFTKYVAKTWKEKDQLKKDIQKVIKYIKDSNTLRVSSSLNLDVQDAIYRLNEYIEDKSLEES